MHAPTSINPEQAALLDGQLSEIFDAVPYHEAGTAYNTTHVLAEHSPEFEAYTNKELDIDTYHDINAAFDPNPNQLLIVAARIDRVLHRRPKIHGELNFRRRSVLMPAVEPSSDLMKDEINLTETSVEGWIDVGGCQFAFSHDSPSITGLCRTMGGNPIAWFTYRPAFRKVLAYNPNNERSDIVPFLRDNYRDDVVAMSGMLSVLQLLRVAEGVPSRVAQQD